MSSYPFPTQVVVATMGVYNFLRRSGFLDEAFRRADMEEDDATKVELPDRKVLNA